MLEPEFVDAAARLAMVLRTNLLEASSLVASSSCYGQAAGGSDCASSPTASATAFSTRLLRAKRSLTDVETPSALLKAASSSSSPTMTAGKGDGGLQWPFQGGSRNSAKAFAAWRRRR